MPRSPVPRVGSAPPHAVVADAASCSDPSSDAAAVIHGVLGGRVLDHVRQRLGDGEVRGRLDRRRQSRRSARRRPRPASGAASASAWTAPTRPRSASTGGWMPRTRSRSSASAVLLGRAGLGEQLRGRRGVAARAAPRPAPRFMPSATSRACAPSCRSRSIRRSSAAWVSTVSARDSVSCSTRSASRLFSDDRQQRAVDGRVGPHRHARRQPPEQQVQHALDDADDRQRQADRAVGQQPAGVAPARRILEQRPRPHEQIALRHRQVRRFDRRLTVDRADLAAVQLGQRAHGVHRRQQHRHADPDRDQRGAR